MGVVCGVGWQHGISFVGIGRRVFDGRLGHHEFAMGVRYFLDGHMWCGIWDPGTAWHRQILGSLRRWRWFVSRGIGIEVCVQRGHGKAYRFVRVDQGG